MTKVLPVASALLLLPAAAALAQTDAPAGSTTTGQLLARLFQGCWACGVYNTIGAIGINFADSVYGQVAQDMTILIGLFTALWILAFAAKLFLPFGHPGATHWNQGATKLMKLAMVLAFLSGSGPFWNYVFTPVMATSLGIAADLANAADSFETNWGGSREAPPSGTIDYCAPPPPPVTGVILTDDTAPAVAALEQMDCPMSRMQGEFGKGIMIGVAGVAQLGCPNSQTLGFIPTTSAVVNLVSGCILILAFGFGFMTFPFLLFDVLMRVMLVVATSPIAVASVLFKPTARIGERALWSLAQCGLTMMFGAAVAGIGKAMMAYVMSILPSGAKLLSWSDLTGAIENSCSANFSADFTSASFYMLIGTAMLMIFMMRRASSLAAELTGARDGAGAREAVAAAAGAAASTVEKFSQYVTKRDPNQARKVAGNDQSK